MNTIDLTTEDRLVATGSLELGLAGDGWLRYGVADLGAVVEEARRRRDLSPIAAAALGRSLSAAALLLRLSLKAPSRLILEVRGDGPIGSVRAEADDAGNVRGTVGNPRVDLPARPDGKLAVGQAVGAGILQITRERSGGANGGDPASYSSQVALVTGEIGVDVAHFLDQSEQTRSAVLLGVLARPEGITGAGGLIVEVLPGAPESVIDALEANLERVGGVSRIFEESGHQGVLESVFAGLDIERLASKRLEHRCRCSRERLFGHLALLPDDDIQTVLNEQGLVEAECLFCGARYIYTPEELRTQEA